MCIGVLVMGRQVRVNLTIDEQVVIKAKDLGLNISKVSENALKRAIKALEQLNPELESKTKFLGEASSKEGSVEPRVGFDPTTNSLQGCRSTGLSHRGTTSYPDLLMFLCALAYRFSVF